MNPWRSLHDLPEYIEEKEDGYPNVRSKEIGDVPVLMMLANKDVKTVEKDDQGKIGESCPCSVWLEVTLKHQGVSVNSLRLECLMELDVGKAD